MADLRVHAIATAVRTRPVYRSPSAFGGDPWLNRLTTAIGVAAEALGLLPGTLHHLPDVPENDVAEHALTRLGVPDRPQPLYVSRSGGEVDPFVAMLPRLVRTRDWVCDGLVLTHLEALTGSAVFEFVSWSVGASGATVLLVDQQVVAPADCPPDALSAVALRIGTDSRGTRVVEWDVGPPPETAGCRTFHGSRSCDAWLGFARAVTAGKVAVGDVAVLHTTGEAQEGWVRLDVDELPVVTGEDASWPG